MQHSTVDPRVVERLNKLLALAKDGGATEAEAQLAMEKAQAIAFDNNLTIAEVEASGKASEGGERGKHQLDGAAMYDYQQELMRTIAEVNFCAVTVRHEWSGRRQMARGYRIIGRAANVATVIGMFDYLNGTINRMAKERYRVQELLSRSAVSWKHGLSRRLQERLKERLERELVEQERAAKQAAAAARHPAAAPTGNALVVVMRNYAKDEEDLNRDLANGWEPGTTARKAAEWEAGREEREARWELREAEQAAREAERLAKLTPKQRAAEEAKAQRDAERAAEQDHRRRERYWANRDLNAYWSGKEAGDTVGLDKQVARNAQRKIS